jgi:tetratricopeptide (TPR) repeat protein
LEATKDPDLVRAAVHLLGVLFDRWPERTELAAAAYQLATCHLTLGDTAAALQAFRRALQVEQKFPNVRTQAAIELPWVIATRGLESEYAEALSVLAACEPAPFPIMRYKLHGASAVMLASTGRVAEAAEHARAALHAAQATESGMRNHKRLGLVPDLNSDVANRLRVLAGAAEQGDEADER